MTEYDYSPEGYEKYLETQNRVSNWVNDQSGRYNQYSSPFAPTHRSTSTPPSHHAIHYSHHSSSRHREGSHHSSAHSSSTVQPSRPEQTRSFTAPVGEVHRSSRSHSHSHSQSRSQQSPPPSSRRAHNVLPTSYVSYGQYRDPYRESSTQKPRYAVQTYAAQSGQIVLPPLRRGQEYHIQPGHGSGPLYVVVRTALHRARYPALISVPRPTTRT